MAELADSLFLFAQFLKAYSSSTDDGEGPVPDATELLQYHTTFDANDKNSDGLLGRNELTAVADAVLKRSSRQTTEAMIADVDANADGHLSAVELENIEHNEELLFQLKNLHGEL